MAQLVMWSHVEEQVTSCNLLGNQGENWTQERLVQWFKQIWLFLWEWSSNKACLSAIRGIYTYVGL